MLRLPLPWLTLIVAALLFFALREKSPTELLSPSAAEPGGFPQTYMIDIETEEFDQQGQLLYRMSTPAAQHFQMDPESPGEADHTLIAQPKLFFFSQNDGNPWRLSAMEGISHTSSGRVTLNHNVRAEQQTPGQSGFTLSTSALTIHTVEQFAETDKAVKMRAPQGEIETIGMQAWLNEDRIELLSTVRGTYAP